MANPLKVVTGTVRLSYAFLHEPQAFEGQEPRYSTAILVPKSDKTTVEKIRNAQKAALEQGKNTKFNGSIPKNWGDTLRDGDEEADLEKNPEYAGHYFMNVRNKQKPGLVDRDLNPIMDPMELYSGCYARVSITAFAYSVSGNKGVSFGLNHVQKVKDGEPFGSVTTPEDDFSPLDDDAEEDSLI